MMPPLSFRPMRNASEDEYVMGTLIYEGHAKVEFEDRTLAHLQVVITSKLRRGEPFNLSWKDESSIGGGRTTVWVHSGCSLVYKYRGSRVPHLNLAWVDALAYVANSPGGLHVVPEPPDVTLHSAEKATA